MDFEDASILLEPRGSDRFLVPHPAFELFPAANEDEKVMK